MQSTHAFWCLKSQKLWTNNPKVLPIGHPKFIKNRWTSMLGHSRTLLGAPLHPMITKMVPKWCPKTPECLQNGVQDQWSEWKVGWFSYFYNDKSCRSFKSCKSIQIANYKSAGYQRGRRQGWSLKIFYFILKLTQNDCGLNTHPYLFDLDASNQSIIFLKLDLNAYNRSI